MADHLVNRGQRPARDDRTGHDHAAGHLLLDHQQRTDRQRRRLQQHAEAFGKGRHHFGDIAGALPRCQSRHMHLPPKVGQTPLHPQCIDHFTRPPRRFAKLSFSAVLRHRQAQRPFGHHPPGHGRHRHNRRPGQRQKAKPRVDQEQDREIQRNPRHIEQAQRRRAGHEAAHDAQIAHRLIALGQIGGGVAAPGTGQPDPKRLGPQCQIQRQRGARHDAGAQEFVKAQKGVKHHHNGEQPHQRRQRPAAQHPVIDLQHIDRSGQHQDVDGR